MVAALVVIGSPEGLGTNTKGDLPLADVPEFLSSAAAFISYCWGLSVSSLVSGRTSCVLKEMLAVNQVVCVSAGKL